VGVLVVTHNNDIDLLSCHLLTLGLIQNADAESIDLIKNLSLRHIEGENTLILVTMPAIGGFLLSSTSFHRVFELSRIILFRGYSESTRGGSRKGS
jgi:hypothetical protein